VDNLWTILYWPCPAEMVPAGQVSNARGPREPRADGRDRLSLPVMLTLWRCQVIPVTCTVAALALTVVAGVAGIEPATRLVLETRALPIELRPFVFSCV
jgi:hypothetical protein